MFDRPPGESEFRSWVLVALWSGLIFATIPFAPLAVKHVGRALGSSALTIILALLAAAALAGVLGWLVHRGKTDMGGFAWFAATSALLMALMTVLRPASPAEAFHYLEYGVLGLLLFRALTHRVRDWSIYIFAVLIGAMIGTADEVIQWLTPKRYFEFADIALNVTGVALAQAMLAGAVRPQIISGWPDAQQWRQVALLAGALALMLALCLAIPS